MASRIRSWRNRRWMPSSSMTCVMTARASSCDSSRAERAVTVARSVTVKLEPKIEAACSTCRVSSGRKLSRRTIVSRSVGGRTIFSTSARPPAVVIAPSCASAASSSVTNSGLPAAPESSAINPGPGSAVTASAASSRTASSARPRRASRRAPAASTATASRSNSAICHSRPRHADEGDRQVRQATDHCGQRQQAGWIGPLQVIGGDHQRPGQRQLLRQVSEHVQQPQNRSPGSLSAL